MRFIFLILFSILVFQSNAQIKLGKHIKNYKIENTDTTIRLLVASSQTEEAYIIRLDSVLYQVTLSDDNLIHYITTSDEKFKTREGLKIGNTYSEIKKSDIQSELKESRGWAKFIKL
ncbi:MAG: hypothetical protein ACXW0H_10165, partial [Methylobacter sp.]